MFFSINNCFKKIKSFSWNIIEIIFYTSIQFIDIFKSFKVVQKLNEIIRVNLYQIKSEPQNDWINLSWYNHTDTKLLEIFFKLSFIDSVINDFLTTLFTNDTLKSRQVVLFIYKQETFYICKEIQKKDLRKEFYHYTLSTDSSKFKDAYLIKRLIEESVNRTLSTFRFIMIEYTHPGLAKPITIHLQQGYYIDGNEILSDLFIARYLQYHHGQNIFKNDYNLSIMDNKFKIINLNHNSRITIKKNDYTVICY